MVRVRVRVKVWCPQFRGEIEGSKSCQGHSPGPRELCK